jgi:Ca2+-binding RTX toxin-like protein
MPGVSLQTEDISYGNLTSGLKKGTVNSFVSNGNISLNFSDISADTVSTQPQTNVLIDAQIELSYYSLDEPLLEESDLVHFVALGNKERAANSFQAISDFTDVLISQGSIEESGTSVVTPKLKLFDFSGNNPEEVDSDEIILQLAESEGVVLLAPNQTSSESMFVNINNELTASACEILLLGEFTVRGGEGKQTFVGDDSKQDLSLGSGDDIVFAGGGDDILIASDGNNYFDGGAGNDEIAAGSGMDVFVGGAGNDVIDGGDGLDKAEYVGSYYDFTIEKQLDSFSVNDRLSLEGTDTLTNVERLEFADGTLAFDTNGNAGQAYRLYQAAFERTPDPVGVGYHVNDIESNGLILYQIAGNFLASPEFESTYGSDLNDSDFVDALYDNVLGRSPDEFEREYYLDRFNRSEGDPLWMDRAASLIGFSESPENMNIVNDDILNGIWMTNDYI